MGRLKELNPYATLSCETSSAELTTDELKGFTMVCASSTSMAKLGAVNDVCRGAGVPFLGIGSMGGAAFAFVDLLEHEYEEIKVSKEEDKDKRKRSGEKIYKEVETKERKTVKYVTLSSSISASWSELPNRPHRLFFALKARAEAQDEADADKCCVVLSKVLGQLEQAGDNANQGSRKRRRNKIPNGIDESYMRAVVEQEGTELCPVCSVMGGIVAQQVIRAMSRKNAPLCNWLLFDTVLGNAVSLNVGCQTT